MVRYHCLSLYLVAIKACVYLLAELDYVLLGTCLAIYFYYRRADFSEFGRPYFTIAE